MSSSEAGCTQRLADQQLRRPRQIALSARSKRCRWLLHVHRLPQMRLSTAQALLRSAASEHTVRARAHPCLTHQIGSTNSYDENTSGLSGHARRTSALQRLSVGVASSANIGVACSSSSGNRMTGHYL